jgi:hypothetical protein
VLRHACGRVDCFGLTAERSQLLVILSKSRTVTVAETRKKGIVMTSNDDFGIALQELDASSHPFR